MYFIKFLPFFLLLTWIWLEGKQSNRTCRDFFPPRPLLRGYHGIPNLAKRQNLSSVPWVRTGISSQLSMSEAPHLRRSGSIRVTCPNHLNWLLSMQTKTGIPWAPLGDWDPYHISKSWPRHPLEIDDFCCLYLKPYSFSPLPELRTLNHRGGEEF